MMPGRLQKVLLCYAAGDLDGELVAETLRRNYDVLWSGSEAISEDVPAGLRAAANQADLVVAVLGRPGSKNRNQTYFQIGIALGMGKATLIVGNQQKPPRFLRDVPFISTPFLTSQPELLQEILADLTHHRSRDYPANLFEMVHPKSEVYKASMVGGYPSSPTEAEIIDSLKHLFEGHEAQVRLTEHERTRDPYSADLVVWHDSLATSYGAPLPIEVKHGASLSRRQVENFRMILRGTGSETLLVVTDTAQEPESWSDGTSLILLAALDDVESALRIGSPRDALDLLRSRTQK